MVVNIWQNIDIGGLGPAPSPSPCKSLPQVRQEMSRRQTNVCQQNPSCDEVQKDLLFLRPGDRAGADTLGLSHWESPHPEKVNLVLPGSLVVDAEGMEDVQEGREEGKELHERKKRKGQLAESNPISSQCCQHGEASQHRAPSTSKERKSFSFSQHPAMSGCP